jgi:hypothetical protein
MFPIVVDGTPHNLKAIERRIEHLSPADQAAIKALQPYERRKADPSSDLLWLLSELDNIDKHRVLLVARPRFTQMRLSIIVDGDADLHGVQPSRLATVEVRHRTAPLQNYGPLRDNEGPNECGGQG